MSGSLMVCEALDVKSLVDRRSLVGRESQIPYKVRPFIFLFKIKNRRKHPYVLAGEVTVGNQLFNCMCIYRSNVGNNGYEVQAHCEKVI